MRRLLSRLVLAALCATPLLARAQTNPELVIEDNDFLGPGGSNIQAIIPLLNNPRIKLLGVTVVVGDDWENAESDRIRRFLEISKHHDIPVYDGAVQPLINTVELMRLREAQFGTIPWKGAWGGLGSIEKTPDSQPQVAKTADGAPTLKAASLPAAMFMIQQIHAHPHQVTIVEAGPMTNLALAIRMDPSFAATAKQLVFMGAYLDLNLMSVTGNADNGSDFNLIFDPEAAHIALTAPWPHITSIANVSNDIVMSQDEIKNLAQANPNPVTAYMQRFYMPLPMWDEVTSAVAADPSLITKSIDAYMDVETGKGINYGHAYVWPDALAPKRMGIRKVRIVQQIDTARFKSAFTTQAQNAMGTH
ncbi:nucleoside hydrolase [Kozakia baliensis]|uniref:Nucleoside hydrolase n=1 Tax=Kozakia baliensis TaxID=153496 RepID=A0A1D8URC3_9PROT|nr:nucleoside hydrolase [Kozakia baliensis]AOX16184.1 nucleoside hydrolase [Kozakia baliensis]GBR28075.1 nucleoside hydrolase [Kozakia baliensis NRIC 0488]GEL63787.1 nucleoside hydrolase [Kozakia baliensis]